MRAMLQRPLAGHLGAMLQRPLAGHASGGSAVEGIAATYDPASDALAIRLAHGVIHETDPGDTVNCDVDCWGKLVALEVLDASDVLSGVQRMQCGYDHDADMLTLCFADTCPGPPPPVQPQRPCDAAAYVWECLDSRGRISCLHVLCASEVIADWRLLPGSQRQINLQPPEITRTKL